MPGRFAGLIAGIVPLAFAVLGGFAAAQAPEFAQQYRQRLGGAIDELRRVVARFDADAAATGRTREGAVQNLAVSADELSRRQGRAIADHVARLERLERQRRDLAEAGPFLRLALFVAEADPGLVAATWHDFEPALPATSEGLAAGGAGALASGGLGALLIAALRRGVRRLRTGRRRPGASPA